MKPSEGEEDNKNEKTIENVMNAKFILAIVMTNKGAIIFQLVGVLNAFALLLAGADHILFFINENRWLAAT